MSREAYSYGLWNYGTNGCDDMITLDDGCKLRLLRSRQISIAWYALSPAGFPRGTNLALFLYKVVICWTNSMIIGRDQSRLGWDCGTRITHRMNLYSCSITLKVYNRSSVILLIGIDSFSIDMTLDLNGSKATPVAIF